jgi:ABC-type multidrug transport system permease subunit
MTSLILQTAARSLVAVLLLFSVFLLLRGHDEPGGGFIGGLVAAAAFALYAIAFDVASTRRMLGMHPRMMIAVGLAILFGSCLSWVTVFLGVLIKDPNGVTTIGFITFLPLQLGTSLAAPVGSLPGWLQAWAGVNPFSQAMDACRALLTGIPAGNSIIATLIWCAIFVAVFCPLAVRAYARQQ